MQFACLAFVRFLIPLSYRMVNQSERSYANTLSYAPLCTLCLIESYKPGSTDNLRNNSLNVTLLYVMRCVSICEVELLLQISDPTSEVL